MRKLLFTACLSVFTMALSAQDTPVIGDQLIVNSPTGQKYNHVKFPKLNFLVKKGKIANYKSVQGSEVVVSDIKTCNKGTKYVVLEKKDGSKFFGYLKTVKANYDASINSGELSVI